MSKLSKIKSLFSLIGRGSRTAAVSLTRFPGWMGKGRIISGIIGLGKVMKDTFSKNTSVSSGLVRVDDKELAAYLSDVDGTDIVADFKDYVSELKKRYPDSSPPVKVFCTSGVIGMYARADMLYAMVYGGIPYILPVHRSLEGIDENDAEFSDSVNRMVARLSSADSDHVVSLGMVDTTINVQEYVLNYARKSPLFDSTDIDPNLVKMAIKNGTIGSIGSLYLPGGYLYDIYAIEPILTRTFRPYRDYTQQQDDLPSGREVILVGGEPEIVCVGLQSAPNGFIYDVWVPNDARYYARAKEVVENCRIPMGALSVDDDEYLEAYAILMKILKDLDEEANGPAQEADAPDIMVNPEDDTDTDEVPVLIELPDYLR